MDEFAELSNNLTEADVYFDMELYGGLLNSFTRRGSNDYDSDTGLKSWASMLEFFDDLF